MTPQQKIASGKATYMSCFFFILWYFGISFEPKYYPGSEILWHTYCDAHRTVCPYCVWWMLSLTVALSVALWAKKQHYSKHVKEETKIYFFLEFCLIFMGNLLLDIAEKINNPGKDCIELRTDQIAYSIGCILWTFCGRFYPEKSLKALRGLQKVFKAIRNAIFYIILFRFVHDIRRTFKRN